MLSEAQWDLIVGTLEQSKNSSFFGGPTPAELKAINETLAAVQQQRTGEGATVWEPLPDGLYLDGALAISYNGADIGFKVDDEPYKGDDWINNYQWLSDCEVRDLRAKEEQYRMCRRIVGENGASDVE